MKKSTRRLGTVGAALAIATAPAILGASPAFADSQWPNCYHMQTGWTEWKETQGYSSITPFYAVWENRNGDLVRSETQYVGVSDYERFRIYGEGTYHWALRGIWLDTYPNIVSRGAWCTGPDDSALNNAIGDEGGGGNLPGPPLPLAGFLPVSVEVPVVHIMHGGGII